MVKGQCPFLSSSIRATISPMFKNFLVLVILIGIGFFLGVSQSDALFKTFPTLHHTTASVITTTPATSLVRCADEVQTAGWQTFRSEHLGINFLYPVNFAVTENSDSVDIKDLTATGSAVDHILLERLSGNFESRHGTCRTIRRRGQ